MAKRRTVKRRRQRRSKTVKQRGGNYECPSGMPARLCEKQKEKWQRLGLSPQHLIPSNIKRNIKNAVANRERRLMPEEERVLLARKRFNWKSRVPEQNAMRKGLGNTNNVLNVNLQNLHEATNANFPYDPTRKEGYVW